MTITHRATVESEHYSYEGYGASADAARRALLEGLHEHAGQMSTAETWPDEMIDQAKIHPVGARGSQFTDFDLGVVAHELVAATAGHIAFRAVLEAKSPEFGWGWVDGFAATRQDALSALIAGLKVLHADDADALAGIETQLDDAYVYAVQEDAAYRGGLIGSHGEKLV